MASALKLQPRRLHAMAFRGVEEKSVPTDSLARIWRRAVRSCASRKISSCVPSHPDFPTDRVSRDGLACGLWCSQIKSNSTQACCAMVSYRAARPGLQTVYGPVKPHTRCRRRCLHSRSLPPRPRPRGLRSNSIYFAVSCTPDIDGLGSVIVRTLVPKLIGSS